MLVLGQTNIGGFLREPPSKINSAEPPRESPVISVFCDLKRLPRFKVVCTTRMSISPPIQSIAEVTFPPHPSVPPLAEQKERGLLYFRKAEGFLAFGNFVEAFQYALEADMMSYPLAEALRSTILSAVGDYNQQKLILGPLGAQCISEAANEKSDDAVALLKASYLLRRGYGSPQNSIQSLVYLERAVRMGLASAFAFLGNFIDRGVTQGRYARDLNLIISLYMKGLELGNATCASNLAVVYEKINARPQDIAHFRQIAVDMGSPMARANAAWSVVSHRDPQWQKKGELAFKYARAAAAAGSAPGMLRVGDCYRDGVGVKKDNLQAAFWYFRGR